MSSKTNSILGRGWSFPPAFDTHSLSTEMASDETLIAQSLDILLGTQRGERPMMPLFGSILHELLFQSVDLSVLTEIELTVKDLLREYEPRIDVKGVGVDDSQMGDGTLLISIDYTIRKTNSRHNKVFPYFVQEGTLLPKYGK